MGNASKVPTDPNMSGEVRSFLDAAQKSIDTLDTSIGTLGTAAFLDVGTTANKVMQLDAAAKIPALDGSQLTNLPGQTGRLIAGTPLVKNPYAASSTTTQAHGLGAAPIYVSWQWECLTANLNYSVGDIITHDGYIGFSTLLADSTNLVLIASAQLPAFTNKTTYAGGSAITAANWKLTLTPYKLI